MIEDTFLFDATQVYKYCYLEITKLFLCPAVLISKEILHNFIIFKIP